MTDISKIREAILKANPEAEKRISNFYKKIEALKEEFKDIPVKFNYSDDLVKDLASFHGDEAINELYDIFRQQCLIQKEIKEKNENQTNGK